MVSEEDEEEIQIRRHRCHVAVPYVFPHKIDAYRSAGLNI